MQCPDKFYSRNERVVQAMWPDRWWWFFTLGAPHLSPNLEAVNFWFVKSHEQSPNFTHFGSPFPDDKGIMKVRNYFTTLWSDFTTLWSDGQAPTTSWTPHNLFLLQKLGKRTRLSCKIRAFSGLVLRMIQNDSITITVAQQYFKSNGMDR